tara:strand:- start:447 stop:1238 length:792 start_codon:yes stop_codon:yes gene_type:complete
MKNILKTILVLILLSNNVYAGSDGNNELSKISKKSEVSKDCFEGINRATFALNQGLDKIVFKPVAQSYRKLPTPIRVGTSNVLDNLSNLITIPNNVLQGDFKTAGTNSARLVVNSTLGILGIFDIAEVLGFPEYVKEDYGQTLGSWGLGHGCYLVLPVLGPSTVRDTTGMFMNVMGGDPYYRLSVNGNNEYLDGQIYATTKMLSGIDFRAKNLDSIDNLEKNSMDFYASVKSLYLQDRERKIANSNMSMDTMDESDWEEIDTK